MECPNNRTKKHIGKPFEDFHTRGESTYFGAIVSCKSSRHTVKEGYKRKMKDVKARLHTTIQGIRIFMYIQGTSQST